MDSKRLKVKMTVSAQLQRAIHDTSRWIRILSSGTIGHKKKNWYALGVWTYTDLMVRLQLSCHRLGSIRYHDVSRWIDDALHPQFSILPDMYTILSINTSSQIYELNLSFYLLKENTLLECIKHQTKLSLAQKTTGAFRTNTQNTKYLTLTGLTARWKRLMWFLKLVVLPPAYFICAWHDLHQRF